MFQGNSRSINEEDFAGSNTHILIQGKQKVEQREIENQQCGVINV